MFEHALPREYIFSFALLALEMAFSVCIGDH
jgi:hypothetical protein